MNTRTLRIGYSPCPNDTYIFHALAEGLVKADGLDFDVRLADVEVLNGWAASGEVDVCKVSAAAAAELSADWVLLRCGGAMGRGVGPVLVAPPALVEKEGEGVESVRNLDGARVAIPGRRTTANLVFGLLCRELGIEAERVELVFDEIMPAVNAGSMAAGVVIHEGRFTFAQYGLARMLDLGGWWEAHSGLPIPLGVIAVRRDLGEDIARKVEALIRASLLHARAHPEDSREYTKGHAQEMDDAVIAEHIAMFVTDYSLDVGAEGANALTALLREAANLDGRKLARNDVFLID